MKKIKGILPLLLAVLIIAGFTMYANQEAKASRNSANCVYSGKTADCYDHTKLNCNCIVVTP